MKSTRRKEGADSAAKRTLQAFLQDEDGFVSKDTILKVGTMVVAGLGIYGAMQDMGMGREASHRSNTTYTNHAIVVNGADIDGSGCLQDELQHQNHGQHNSYTSY